VEKTIAAHQGCLRAEPDLPADAPAEQRGDAADLIVAAEAVLDERVENAALVACTRARYEAVQALKTQRQGTTPMMPELGLATETASTSSPARPA
jgi:hypothetical protein